MMRKSVLLLLCLGLLSACERAANPVAQRPESVPLVVESAVEAPAVEVASIAPVDAQLAAEAVEATPARAEPQPAAKPKAEVGKAPRAKSESTPALDLSVPQELFAQALEGETREDLAPLLPPLFGEKPELQSPFQISGRLISNEREDDYWDSIEGAEVQFEFKQ
ncbi:hypothetical protein JLK41_10325 [Ectopseudomonas khazarica]|nr:hypothetical protein [Pseudomonas khazarica]QTS88522.1 hypothetical protein JLK41_10325 [Pseudomonas khazarica]